MCGGKSRKQGGCNKFHYR